MEADRFYSWAVVQAVLVVAGTGSRSVQNFHKQLFDPGCFDVPSPCWGERGVWTSAPFSHCWFCTPGAASAHQREPQPCLPEGDTAAELPPRPISVIVLSQARSYVGDLSLTTCLCEAWWFDPCPGLPFPSSPALVRSDPYVPQLCQLWTTQLGTRRVFLSRGVKSGLRCMLINSRSAHSRHEECRRLFSVLLILS